MRHGRAKASRRTLQFYRLNAPHLKPPHKVLLDGTFLVASVRNKVPLRDRLSKTLQGEPFACHVARSTLAELEALSDRTRKGTTKGSPPDVADADDVFARARRYGLDECEIVDDVPADDGDGRGANGPSTKDFSDASRDVYDLASEGGTNLRGYFVATQDDALADALRSTPYVPLFRLGRAVLLLESPSAASRREAGSAERGKLASAGGLMTAEEREMVDAVKERERKKRRERTKEERKKLEKRSREEVGGSFGARKKKKAKGPNPLSCKRKKT
ncbi:hypothetical protein ACHAWF_003141 [Thalassiosira exigua]